MPVEPVEPAEGPLDHLSATTALWRAKAGCCVDALALANERPPDLSYDMFSLVLHLLNGSKIVSIVQWESIGRRKARIVRVKDGCIMSLMHARDAVIDLCDSEVVVANLGLSNRRRMPGLRPRVPAWIVAISKMRELSLEHGSVVDKCELCSSASASSTDAVRQCVACLMMLPRGNIIQFNALHN